MKYPGAMGEKGPSTAIPEPESRPGAMGMPRPLRLVGSSVSVPEVA